MMRKVKIDDGGDTGLITGANVDKSELLRVNAEIERKTPRTAVRAVPLRAAGSARHHKGVACDGELMSALPSRKRHAD
ncbi:MAG: hypothetical protein ACLSDO_01945 [Anaerotruncus colihominis]